MRAGVALPLVLGACYTPPDLPLAPGATPVLGGEGAAIEVCAPGVEARVACVVDGDTVDVNGCGDEAWRRVRLLGIDAPETGKPGQPEQCGAVSAAQALSRVVAGRTVALTFDATCTDVYGRTLAWVWLDREAAEAVLPATDVTEVLRMHRWEDDPTAPVALNTWMLLQGHARRFDEDWVAPLRHELALLAAERTAAGQRRSVWSACPE